MDAYIYVDNILTYTVTGLSTYSDLYYSSQWQNCITNYGAAIWEQTTGTYQSFFSSNSTKKALDIDGSGVVDINDALAFMNRGNNTLASAAMAISTQLLTDEDFPYVISVTPTWYDCSIRVHHGDENSYLNYTDFKIIYKRVGRTEAGTRLTYTNQTSDFTATTNTLYPDTTYVAYLCGYLDGAVIYHDTVTFTTSSAPVLPSVTYSTSLHTITLNISVESGYTDYDVSYKKLSETTFVTRSFINRTTDFTVNLTGLESGTWYDVHVETDDSGGTTYRILDAQIFVPNAYSARIAFDVGQGSGTFSTLQSAEETSSPVEITIPSSYTPTAPMGYAFNGWLLNSETVLPGQIVSVVAGTDNPLYTATAQYSVFPGVRVYDGTDFVTAYTTIYDGTSWVAAIPYIYNGSSWVQVI